MGAAYVVNAVGAVHQVDDESPGNRQKPDGTFERLPSHLDLALGALGTRPASDEEIAAWWERQGWSADEAERAKLLEKLDGEPNADKQRATVAAAAVARKRGAPK